MSVVRAPAPYVSPVDMLYNLLSSSIGGISVTQDDEVTIISPQTDVAGTIAPESPIYVKKDPYPQEAEVGLDVPLVVVGPRVGPRQYEPYPGYLLAEAMETIEVRVMTRSVDAPYRVSGELLRSKILGSINAVVRANHYDPDGSHVYQYIAVSDPGRDMNQPQGVALYKSAMAIEVYWFE